MKQIYNILLSQFQIDIGDKLRFTNHQYNCNLYRITDVCGRVAYNISNIYQYWEKHI